MKNCSYCQENQVQDHGNLCYDCDQWMNHQTQEVGEDPYAGTDVDFPYDYGEV
jgi:hypothetical protein